MLFIFHINNFLSLELAVKLIVFPWIDVAIHDLITTEGVKESISFKARFSY